MSASSRFDAIVVGGGAAGLFCAGLAGQLGLRVLVLDHSERVAEKIRISGGGRCNFTNREVTPANFLSENPRFSRTALQQYSPGDFLALLKRHRVGWHEKHQGQLFCDDSSEDIIRVLLHECEAGNVTRWQATEVSELRHDGHRFVLVTPRGEVHAPRLVVATGGLSIPKIGATDFGHRLARQWGHRVVNPRPALVPLTFEAAQWARFVPLAGLSLPVDISTGPAKGATHFTEDLLFTHRGLSGPAILQISSYWQSGSPLRLNLAPKLALGQALVDAKPGAKRKLANVLGDLLPSRLAQTWLAHQPDLAERWLAETRDRDLHALGDSLQAWDITPSGTEGYKKAEVTAGGVCTREIHPHTMESRRQPGLYFIGEVMDVTGWLGGYNFQWAWASAATCARAMAHAASTQA